MVTSPNANSCNLNNATGLYFITNNVILFDFMLSILKNYFVVDEVFSHNMSQIYYTGAGDYLQFIFQFEKRNGSSRMDVVHDAIQVANIADLVRTTLLLSTKHELV